MRVIGLFVVFFALSCSLSAQDQEEEYKQVPPPANNTQVDEQQQASDEAKEEEDDVPSDKKWKWENFRVGGNFGLQFGNITYIDISPTFGYYVIPNKLQVGVGTKFIYYRQAEGAYYDPYSGNYYIVPKYSTAIYGGGLFTNYTIWKGLFVHGEYEMVSKRPNNPYNYPGQNRIRVDALLIGGGYSQPIGKAGNLYVSALYDVLNTDESIYSGTFGRVPIILRIGFGFGFSGR